jgi:hypothetical protein
MREPPIPSPKINERIESKTMKRSPMRTLTQVRLGDEVARACIDMTVTFIGRLSENSY